MKMNQKRNILIVFAVLTLLLSGCTGESSEAPKSSAGVDTSVSSTAEISEISAEIPAEEQASETEKNKNNTESSITESSKKESSADTESKTVSADEISKSESQENSHAEESVSVSQPQSSAEITESSVNHTSVPEIPHETSEKSQQTEKPQKTPEASKPKQEKSSPVESIITEENSDEQILITSSENLWTDKNITVKAGKKVKWYIDIPKNTNVYEGMGGREDLKRNSCVYSIKIPALGIGTESYSYEESHVDLSAGRTLVCEFTPIEAGDIMFTCWMGEDCHCNYIHVIE
ncbi:MAG: hypothetical protein IJ192_14700 [Clostridia bacterium]|nr:hypothetical protein [Clostridia bacterium]